MQIFTLSYRGRLIKTFLVMKLYFLLIFLACFKVSASVHAQTITLNEKNAPLVKILKQIEKQSGYNFFYKNDLLKNTAPVTIHLDHVSLSEALDKCFAGQPLIYEIVDNTIIVKAKGKSLLPNGKRLLKTPQKVSGKVSDTTGTAMPSATIHIKGSTVTFSTDGNGEFSIVAQPGDEVTISYIGYKTYDFIVTENMPFLNITLRLTNNALNEVVVSTGYQDIPRERATGSFSQPVKEMFNQRVAPDVLSKLAGITSGLVFNSNTTASLSGTDINIRGRSTIFANDQPLIVVDGFPYNGDINNINPNDVETVTVLKDAAAASIWGVRAGNGVIVITTKKGKMNTVPTINFNANTTLYNRPDLNYNPNQLSASSYIDVEKFLFQQGNYDANLTDITNYPVISPAVELLAKQRDGTISSESFTKQLNNLQSSNFKDQAKKYLYRNAVNQQYNINISGGSLKSTYYLSGGYDYNLPTAKANSYQRITLSTLNTFKPINNLDLSIGVNLIQTKNKIDNTVINTMGHAFPYTQIADASGHPLPISYGYRNSYVQDAPSYGFLDWSYSPLKDLGSADNVVKNNDVRLFGALRYTFLKGLSAELKYQYQFSNIQNRNLQNQATYFTRNMINTYSVLTNGEVSGYNLPSGDILGLNNTNTTTTNLRATLNYNRTWNKSELAAIAGFEYSQVKSEMNGSTLYGYNDDNATFANVNTTDFYVTNPSGNSSTISNGLTIGGTLDRIRSSFANVAYSYLNRYTLSASGRVDGSNYFGVATNQKFLPLWSIGAKWDISREPFYKIAWLTDLHFRATFGYNGNLDRSITGVTTFYYLSNAQYTNLPYAFIQNVGNPDLKWEKTGIANFALDFSTKQGILSGGLEYYFRKVSDVLGYKTFPYNAGIMSLQGNYSDMSGQGFDINLTSKNLSGKLKWSTTLIFSHSLDKVTGYDVIPLASQLVSADGNGTVAVPSVGKPVFALYSYKFAGLNPETGNPVGLLNGVSTEDYDAIINNSTFGDLKYSGPARPAYFGGINNHFAYKGFGLDMQINYKLGYYFRRPTINYSSMTSAGAYLRVNKDYDLRWQNPGDEQHTKVPSLIYPFSSSRDQFYQASDANVEKADHIRLQDISLSYTLNRSHHPKLPFSNLQLYLYANNIGIIWRANHSGLDPDAVPGGSNTVMPTPRSFAIGLKGTL